MNVPVSQHAYDSMHVPVSQHTYSGKDVRVSQHMCAGKHAPVSQHTCGGMHVPVSPTYVWQQARACTSTYMIHTLTKFKKLKTTKKK